jgi:AcrR family transcriptional regulator
MRAGTKQKRQSPDDGRREFVAKATEFFSEEGFGGGARGLARRPGVTQPLLYRHFPSKDDLIREVYRMVYLDPLETGWEKLLTDRTRAAPRPSAEILSCLYRRDLRPEVAAYLPLFGPEGTRYQPLVCRHG